MPSRRQHLKSHHGCLHCKARRIKCDEARPTCSACLRKNLTCIHSDWVAANRLYLATNGKTVKKQPEAPDPLTMMSKRSSVPPAVPYRPLTDGPYVSWLCSSLSGDAVLQYVLLKVLPKLTTAYRHVFDRLIMLSATHLTNCRFNAQLEHRKTAMAELDSVLQPFNKMLRAHSDLSQDDYQVLILTSWVLNLIHMITLAQGTVYEDDVLRDQVVGLFVMPQGTAALVRDRYFELQSTCMAPLLVLQRYHDVPVIDTMFSNELEAAMKRLAKFNDIAITDAWTRGIYAHAIQELYDTFRRADAANWHMHQILYWGIKAGEGFVLLLKQRQPMAMVILAHFCVFLSKIRRPWWTRRVAQTIIQTAWNELPESWHCCLEWPMACVMTPRDDTGSGSVLEDVSDGDRSLEKVTEHLTKLHAMKVREDRINFKDQTSQISAFEAAVGGNTGP